MRTHQVRQSVMGAPKCLRLQTQDSTTMPWMILFLQKMRDRKLSRRFVILKTWWSFNNLAHQIACLLNPLDLFYVFIW